MHSPGEKILKKTICFTALGLLVFFVHAQNEQLASTSRMDWTQNKFSSSVTLDIDKAGISMPSGKLTAINKINTELPDLIKDPLLSLTVDSDSQLQDYVIQDNITLEELTKIVDSGKKSPAIFVNQSSVMKSDHILDTLKISRLLIKHRFPYKNPKPVDSVPSRVYTGIIIDARGQFAVHGEYVKDDVKPCFFPKIWDSEMNLIYERNMGEPQHEAKYGMVRYGWSDGENDYTSTVGIDPLRISARKVYGRFRTDPVISRNDALKILSVPENLELLKEGKIVVLLDKENLVCDVAVPEKKTSYYSDFKTIKEYLFNSEDAPVVQDTVRGIQILYDLKFVADSAQLLEGESEKIKNLADSLKKINIDNAYTILVEGHTADVQKPEGQMRLSIQRTQTIINELVSNGLDRSLFSYRGYGGTQPIATNSTEDGRAMNRRVIITARPKATYIQRK